MIAESELPVGEEELDALVRACTGRKTPCLPGRRSRYWNVCRRERREGGKNEGFLGRKGKKRISISGI